MRTWTRVERQTLCGGCGAHVSPGGPMQAITIPNVSGSRRRCVLCADELVPADLPSPEPKAGIQPTAKASTFERFTAKPKARTAVNWTVDGKQQAVGE